MNPPSALHGAMSRDRKPFTYTPGGLDLSEIKSERMAKRLMRNAMNQGVPEVPSQSVQSPPMPSTPVAVPNFNCLPVQVFPTFPLPANPKSLLRTRSNPDQPRESQRVLTPSQIVNASKQSGTEQLPEINNKNMPMNSQVNSPHSNSNNRPVSMYEYGTTSRNANTLPRSNYGSDGYTAPLLPEISYDAEYFHVGAKNSNGTESTRLAIPVDSENNNKSAIAESESLQIGNLDVSIKPLSDKDPVTAPTMINLVEDVAGNGDEQREVKVVKKQVKKEKKVEETEKKDENQNGAQNGDENAETQLTVKLPSKKSGAKTETKVEVFKTILPDGTVEEVKKTTTKTTIDGKTEISTKTEKRTLPKEEAEAEVDEVEEEEEETENGEVVVQEVNEENEEEEVVEEPKKTVVKKTVVKESPAAKENEQKDKTVKKEERSETTTTKKVVVVQKSTKKEQESEEEEVEEEEEEEEESEEVEPVVVKQVKSEKTIEKPVQKQSAPQKQESKDIEVEEEDEEVEEEEEVVVENKAKTEKQEQKVEKSEVKQQVEEEVEEEESEDEVKEEKVETKAPIKEPSPKREEEEEVEEEEEEEEEEEKIIPKEAKQEVKVEKTVEAVQETKQKEQEEEESEYTEEEEEPDQKKTPEPVPETKSEPEKQEPKEVKDEQPVRQPESKVPLREPSIPLEKVEDVEIKPIGPASATVSKSVTENTEIVTSSKETPSGALSTQTEFNRIENIVTVNRTTKTLDHTYEQLTQHGIPTVKTYFAPNRERVSTSPQPARPYQPVYPPEPTTERRHSLLLDRLSIERQVPPTDAYQNNYQYSNQTYDQQRQWSQEPQSEVVNVSNVKPSTITNQQWYQQTRKDNVIYNNVTPTTPASAPQWSQPQPQTQYQPTSQYQPPQNQYQPSHTENTTQDYSRTTSNLYQQNSYPSYTPKPSNWGSSNLSNTDTLSNINNQSNQYSYINKDTSESYKNTTQQYSSSYVPPPWEQDASYVADNSNQNYYQPPPPSNTYGPSSNQSWKPTPPPSRFSKSTPTSYVPPAPNQSFVKPVNTIELPKIPGRKTYYSEYERRYITVPESTYIPGETKFQPQPDPSPQYYYDNNEQTEAVEHQWRKELREFTEKSTHTQHQTEQTSVKPPWEDDSKYAKAPSATYTPTPTWSQTLRPRTWRDRSFESEYVGSQEFSKTNTLGRGRPLSSYTQSNVETTIPERSRGVSVDRYNPKNYQSPIPSEHPPAQSHTLNPTASTPAKGYHNPNVPAYHSRISAEPREQPATFQHPRQWGESRASPIQSRSFKYLQWITGTDE